MTYEALSRRLADVLGDRLPTAWREAYQAVPRHLFIPDRAHRAADGARGSTTIDRAADPREWLEAVYSEDIIVTQHDERGRASSSCSMPFMVFAMLDLLDVEPGQRVLEIGAGTGWNAGLLAHRLGDDQVVSVEIDPVVANGAREALAAAGHNPLVVTGDGAYGHRPRAPYDRITATCTVYQVPYPWVEQTVSGARIATPWRDPFCHAGKLLALTVAGDGTASGRFVDWASFMMSRPQRMPTDEVPPAGGTDGTTELHPGLPLDGDHAESAVGMAVPDCQWWREGSDDGYEVRLDDVASQSWAAVGPLNDDERRPYPVRQGGPRRLWNQVEAAYRWWENAGRPDMTRFGITVTPDRQWAWLDDPGREIGRVNGR